MIVIKVEMWPGGNPNRAQEFTRAYISNDVLTTVKTAGCAGDYTAQFHGGIWGREDNARLMKRVWKTGTVRGFDRVRRGVWDLIYQALQSAVGDRNP